MEIIRFRLKKIEFLYCTDQERMSINEYYDIMKDIVSIISESINKDNVVSVIFESNDHKKYIPNANTFR